MTEHLSEEELERIARFAATPAYEREPEQLLPEDERPEDEDGVEAPRTER
jgi:hypothetical protein